MTARSGTTADGADGGPARHVPVLIEEVLRFLGPAAGGTYIDGTFGAGGYSRAILASGGAVIAIDRDPTAISGGASLEKEAGGRLTLTEGRFADLDAIARDNGAISWNDEKVVDTRGDRLADKGRDFEGRRRVGPRTPRRAAGRLGRRRPDAPDDFLRLDEALSLARSGASARGWRSQSGDARAEGRQAPRNVAAHHPWARPRRLSRGGGARRERGGCARGRG